MSGDRNDLDVMMTKLNTKATVEWTDEMRVGQPAFGHLMLALKRETLPPHQVKNALLAMFRLRTHDTAQEFPKLLEAMAGHDHRGVRTMAAKLLVGLERLPTNVESSSRRSSAAAALSNALGLGLEEDVQRLVSDYLAGKVDGFEKSR